MTNERLEEVKKAFNILGFDLPYETQVQETRQTYAQTWNNPAEYAEVFYRTSKEDYEELMSQLCDVYVEFLNGLEQKAQDWYDREIS